MQAVIFDVDGTLVDSVDLHARAWKEALQHFGHDIPFDEIRSQIGKGGDQLMPVFLSKEELAAKGEELEKFRGELFKANYLEKVTSFPKVRELFHRLLTDRWKVAVASSAKQEELKVYLEICDVADLLDATTSSDDAEKSKPFPDIFQAAADRLGVAPKECIVVGDSPYDAQAAAKCGISSIGFLCGGFKESELTAAGFQTLYQGAEELLAKYEDSLFHRERPR